MEKKMNFFRNNWYDVGGVLGICTLLIVWLNYSTLSDYQLLMWLSLVSLFFHQMEEYRIVGTFPGMVNKVMFQSNEPDRYPLNSNTSLIINVWIGWTIYLLAALAGERLVWLGLASIIVSLGNIIAHTIVFNIKGKTVYNAGLVTCWLFFAPCVVYFFTIIIDTNLATSTDYIVGIILGIIINVVGILKLITWLADRNTKYIFKNSQLLPADRNQ